MKNFSRFLVVTAVVATVVACAADGDGAAQTSGRLASEIQTARYQVVALPAHGADSTEGISINDVGWIAGHSTEGETKHASLWLLGAKLDLGTLGGPNSAVLWPVKNVRGVVSGVAETEELDPLQEDWSCSAFFPTVTHHVCRGFVWEAGVMRPLGTFGGTHGFATGTNNFGQTVGWAENTVHDPSCNPPQVLQFRAALWGPGRDQLQELLPLAGDSTSAATAINDLGQVVGISGICGDAVGGRSAAHMVLWENGAAIDIGSLGGVAWNTPMAINQRGDVVGFANNPTADPPTRFRPLPFLWTREGGIRPLPLLSGHTRGQALGINGKGQVVGLSCGTTCRGVLWQDLVPTDLNDLALPDRPGAIAVAGDINELGMITGRLVTPSGKTSAFVAVPRK